MQSFFEWFKQSGIPLDHPWLILGKGPTFSRRAEFDLKPFLHLSLNHAVREQCVKLAHIIDLNVVGQLGEALERNAEYVVMPWRPHVDNDPGCHNLDELSVADTQLRRLRERGRLLWYNLSSAKPRDGSPIVNARYFSAEAALNLLAAAGVKTVRSLGIDGGSSYSSTFDDLKDKTLLANSRASFNEQFQEFAKTILSTGIDYAPLDIESPIRIFVATTEDQMLAVKVLEYSIKKHTSMSTVVSPLHYSGIAMPMPKDTENQPRTPFSFQRFIIPEAMNWKGRAIYLDSDMQVFKDMRELWTLPMDGAELLAVREPSETGRRPQFSVMLLDCGELDWRIKDIVEALDAHRLTYEHLMYEMRVATRIIAAIDPSWNSLERYEPTRTALLHYTDMDTQPWTSLENPHGYLWIRDLIAAIDGNFISKEYIDDQVRQGFVRPSLLWQIDNRVEDPLSLPKRVRILDQNFKPPYLALPRHSGTPWNTKAAAKAAARRKLRQRWPYQLQRSLRQRFAATLSTAIELTRAKLRPTLIYRLQRAIRARFLH
jgi:Glycosyl transferase family 8